MAAFQPLDFLLAKSARSYIMPPGTYFAADAKCRAELLPKMFQNRVLYIRSVLWAY